MRRLAGLVVAVSALVQPPPARVAIDFLVLDSAGRPITDLRPAEISITIDGRPRVVAGLHYVYRGPGAAVAAAAFGARSTDPATSPLAEPARTVLIAVDETSVPHGSEPNVLRVVKAIVDGLGPADRAALVRLPEPGGAPEVATDREPIRAEAVRLAGRALTGDQLARLREQPPPSLAADDVPPQRDRTGAVPSQGNTSAAEDALRRREQPFAAAEPLLRAIAGLRALPGRKTVILVSGGLAGVDASSLEVRAALARIVDEAAFARAGVLVVKPDAIGAQADISAVAGLARTTGGGVFSPGRNIAPEMQRLAAEMSGGYLAEVEPLDSDRDGRPHNLDIAVRRAGVRVQVARRWVARSDALPAALPASPAASRPEAGATSVVSPVPAAPPAKPAPASPRLRREPIVDPELRVVLARATEYVTAYMREFTNVVAEEDYQQTATTTRASGFRGRDETRRTKSDFLMVTPPGQSTWIPFRDVFEVNGTKVRDREDRLRNLFLEAPATALRDARVISAESARFNLGSVGRTINVPTLPLEFLTPERVDGLNVRRGGEDTVDGIRTWRVDFQEWASPTLIQTDSASDLPASGSFWIDPPTGRVVKTLLRTAPRGIRGEATVVYRRNDAIGLWVPFEMRERYAKGNEETTTKATYSNFRRFMVKTEEKLVVPK